MKEKRARDVLISDEAARTVLRILEEIAVYRHYGTRTKASPALQAAREAYVEFCCATGTEIANPGGFPDYREAMVEIL